MSEPIDPSNADRNLLFGILAVQVNFIDRDALVAAMNAWMLDKKQSLGQILLEQQKLTAEQLNAINNLIEQHLKLHGDNIEESLRATQAWRSDLMATEDPDLRASISKLGSRPAAADETATYRPSENEETRYRKLWFHADGGQGRVFVADDAELHREVALKEIKPEHAGSSDSRLRLVLEAEITGGLEHPGIVPVYGLGAYRDGRPYYAMRFIRGDNLDASIKQFHAADVAGRDSGDRRLAFRQLLRRFVDVCNAVAYAHSRGVVHRDLKPKNVMLGKFGETLVVDWGLAKVGSREGESDAAAASPAAEKTLCPASGSSVETTMDGAEIGTAPFMSPEQACGRISELRPSSDIYSLGSSLYVLLTGQAPYQAPTRPEILEKVRSGQFTPPKQVKAETPAALDAVCRKAMSLQPNDRYKTALELAAEVEHWLADEPVAAYPEPWTARATRWARRHRAAVTIAGLFLLCAVIGLAISTALVSAEQRRTEAQRQLAVKNYEISREQSFNIIKLIEASEPEFARVPVLHERRAELLDTASSACREFLQQEPNDVELQRRAANIFRFAANFKRLTYEHKQAESLYQDAISLRRRLLLEFPQSGDRAELADALRDFASAQAAQGHWSDATESIRLALEIAQSLWEDDPTRPSYRRALGLLLLNDAFLQSRRGTPGSDDRAIAAIERSIELLQALVTGPLHERHPYEPLLLASALNQRAIMEREAGERERAVATHGLAVKHLIGLRDAKLKEVNDADVEHFLAECQIEQCQTWAEIDKPNYLANAEKNAGLAINKVFELAQKYPAIPTYDESLAKAFLKRGELRLKAKNFAGAGEHLHSAKEILERLVKKYGDVPSLRGLLGNTYLGLGVVARELQSGDEAQWFELATFELKAAMRLAPDDALHSRSWDDLEKTRRDAEQR